jgi:hypothetical protein
MSIPASAHHAIPTTTLFQLMHIVVALAKWAQGIYAPNATHAHGQSTSILTCRTIRRLYEFTEHAGLTGVQLVQQLSAAAKALAETTGPPPPPLSAEVIGGQTIHVIPSSPPSHGHAFLYPQQTPDLAFAYSADYSGTVTPDFSHHSPQQHSPQSFTPSITPVGTTPEMQSLQIHQPSLGLSLVLPPASWAGPAHDWSAASSCEPVWATASEPQPTQDGVDPQLWYGGGHPHDSGMDGTQQAWQRLEGNAMDGDFPGGGYGFNVLRR